MDIIDKILSLNKEFILGEECTIVGYRRGTENDGLYKKSIPIGSKVTIDLICNEDRDPNCKNCEFYIKYKKCVRYNMDDNRRPWSCYVIVDVEE